MGIEVENPPTQENLQGKENHPIIDRETDAEEERNTKNNKMKHDIQTRAHNWKW